VNKLAQSRIHCWAFMSVALDVGVIIEEVQNIVVFSVCLISMSVALLM
jgi:hypothetical protein